MKTVKSAPSAPTPATSAPSAPVTSAPTEVTLEAALDVIAKSQATSPAAIESLLAIAKAVRDAQSKQGAENSRLPILQETARHSTNSKEGKGTQRTATVRDVSSLSDDALKARKARERLLSAALTLGMIRA